MMFWRFIHVVACLNSSLFFIAGYKCHSLFIYSSVRHLGYFHLLALVSNFAVDICDKYLFVYPFSGIWDIPKSRSSHMVILCLTF